MGIYWSNFVLFILLVTQRICNYCLYILYASSHVIKKKHIKRQTNYFIISVDILSFMPNLYIIRNNKFCMTKKETNWTCTIVSILGNLRINGKIN